MATATSTIYALVLSVDTSDTEGGSDGFVQLQLNTDPSGAPPKALYVAQADVAAWQALIGKKVQVQVQATG